jgi:hypothetical protein
MAEEPTERGVATSRDRHRGRRTWRARSRGAVHLGLLLAAALALGTLQLLHVRDSDHVVVGFAFVGLVLLHLLQRRQTLGHMARHVVAATTILERSIRLAASDLVLVVITVNVLVSGIVDWGRGEPSELPLPVPFDRWHLDSGLALIVYLVVHVWRRRKRLWRSTIR